MTKRIIYTANTRTIGGRDGMSRSSDGKLEVKLSSPSSKRAGTNPEQLFAAGWSACLLGALEKAASERGLQLPPEAAVEAEVDLTEDASGCRLSARLNVAIPGLDRGVSEALTARAHEICPYSRATRSNIIPEINVI